MPTTAEAITKINDRYYAALARARRHPIAGRGKSTGIRRDRMIARARRERQLALTRVGVRSY